MGGDPLTVSGTYLTGILKVPYEILMIIAYGLKILKEGDIV